MTERGLPTVDGAPACPFVAFDDDRDERAASPDHRHRCYAEAEPAPRALAHQEAYCLSSAFPVCPTFQDWARREAAHSKLEPERERPVDDVAALAAAPPPPRNPPRSWAAPPPWASGLGGSRGQEQLWEDDDAETSDQVPTAEPEIPRRGRGLSGSYADRVASDTGVPGLGHEPIVEDDDQPATPLKAESPPSAADATDRYEPTHRPEPEQRPTYEPEQEPAQERAYEPEPERAYEPEPTYRPEPESPSIPADAPAPSGSPPPAPVARYGELDSWDDEIPEGPPEPQIRRRRERETGRGPAYAGGTGRGGGDRGGGARDGGGGGSRAGGERPRRDGHAPEWEQARPLEAYPTLRSRRLSELSIPPLLVGVVALAIAAAVLFALPGLLGFGNPSAGGSGAPTTPVRTPLVTAAPTPVPEPTDQLYTVQAGDTMSRIANRFDIELADLIAANAERIANPDQLQIGDQVLIPAQNPEELPAASEIPAAN